MKVSVITITNNRANLIGETIQSVLNQTYQGFEHIIIDDGSTDKTEEVVKGFGDGRIKYYKFDYTGNIGKLMNLGLRNSDGEVIAILDSDDLWLENKLEIVIETFYQNKGLKLITHNISYFENIQTIGKPYYNYQDDFYENAVEKVLKFAILPFPVLVFKKEIIESEKAFNENLFDAHQDFLFTIAGKHKLYFIRDVLTLMRIHSGNTHRQKKLALGYFSPYYRSCWNLFLNRRIGFKLLIKGYVLNTIKMLIYLLRRK